MRGLRLVALLLVVAAPSGAASGSLGLRAASIESVVHRFQNSPDGAYPLGDLTAVHGIIYGTTTGGGATGYGTIFELDSSGTEHLLYSFGKRISAAGGVIDVGGTLYGTTGSGGSKGFGAVFALNPSGSYSVLHSFLGGTDGRYPAAPLIDVNGTFYGTTDEEGSSTSDCGTIFELTPPATYNVLYRFSGTDGCNPHAALTYLDGTLYGTTQGGGAYNFGTAFGVTLSGTENMLYSLGASAGEGRFPNAPLAQLDGVLYSTTAGGGDHGCNNDDEGCGTVFAVTTSGAGHVVFRFHGNPGYEPVGGLVAINGSLYGTLSKSSNTDGAVYQLMPSGGYRVLYEFQGGNDGKDPRGTLVDVGGTLFGTTYVGGGNGNHTNGWGTVFSITP